MFGGRWSLLVMAILGLGCTDDCHDVPCGSSLIVELAPDQGLEDGSYEVTLETPLGTTVCGFVIAGDDASMLTCSPDVANLDKAELPAFMLVRYITDQPETLHVTVTRDGDELTTTDVTPEYEQVIADPGRCGGACTSAQVSVAF